MYTYCAPLTQDLLISIDRRMTQVLSYLKQLCKPGSTVAPPLTSHEQLTGLPSEKPKQECEDMGALVSVSHFFAWVFSEILSSPILNHAITLDSLGKWSKFTEYSGSKPREICIGTHGCVVH